MVSAQTGQKATTPRPGQHLRMRLVGGQVVEGRVTRADTRTVRLQATGRHGLTIVYRQAVTAMEAAWRRQSRASWPRAYRAASFTRDNSSMIIGELDLLRLGGSLVTGSWPGLR